MMDDIQKLLKINLCEREVYETTVKLQILTGNDTCHKAETMWKLGQKLVNELEDLRPRGGWEHPKPPPQPDPIS